MSAATPQGAVLAVDPGSDKCGLAVVSGEGRVALLEVVPRWGLADRVRELAAAHPLAAVLVGDRTGSSAVVAELQALGLSPSPTLVPEHNTTLRARDRYFADHPPRGWRRLLPRGMLLPPRPVDDYAALVMAEDWLAQGSPARSPGP